MTASEQRPPDDEHDRLVAYLDREMPAEERAALEDRLSSDPSLRRSLAALDQSWQMLDQLPRPNSSEQFTRDTLSMATLDSPSTSGDQVDRDGSDKFRRWRHRARQWAPWILAASVGYLAVAIPLRTTYRRDLTDYPVADNMDVYRYAESIEFIKMLDAEGLFSEIPAVEDNE